MSQTLAADRSSTSDPARRSEPRPSKRKLRTPIMLQVVAMIGIGALLYPSAADWFSTLGHNAEVSGYVREVQQLPDEVRIEKLQIAKDYNAHMPASVLRDPYGANGDADLRDDAAYQAYTQVLRVSDNGVIGEILYPRLNIGLPIYHGTGEASISNGAGHLYGSSLPVGGPSTHSVLTSHSGLVNASLFTPLTKAEVGDTFQVTVLGETHHYRVDGIETIEPFVTDSLGITPGEDRVTLITCTPIGINSHRLLVHAIRIPAPEDTGERVIAGDGRAIGFPWWVLGFLAASGLAAYLLFVPPRRKRANPAGGSRAKGAGARTAGRHRATADEHSDLTRNDQERRA